MHALGRVYMEPEGRIVPLSGRVGGDASYIEKPEAAASQLISAKFSISCDRPRAGQPEAATDTNDLRHGQVDLEIGSTEPGLPDISHETIGNDRLVIVLGHDHP